MISAGTSGISGTLAFVNFGLLNNLISDVRHRAPLRAVSGVEHRALRTALEKLAEADILLVQGLPPESEYRFKHALIQDAAYETAAAA
jgi:hypothetical protein